MYADVIKATDAAVTSSASIQYLQLNDTPAELGLTECQKNGDAPFGGVTSGHQRLRERFWVWYYKGGVTGYRWTEVYFVETTTPTWCCKLTQDQRLDAEHWYKGPSHSATFGSSSGQFDLTASDIRYYELRCHTLSNEKKVEELALSHLQGRMRFGDTVAINSVNEEVLSYDELWERIYAKSALFQSRLSKWYDVPLTLGMEADRHLLRELVAKAVLVEMWQSYLPFESAGTRSTIEEWKLEVANFFKRPTDLLGEDREGRAGTIRVERA